MCLRILRDRETEAGNRERQRREETHNETLKRQRQMLGQEHRGRKCQDRIPGLSFQLRL